MLHDIKREVIRSGKTPDGDAEQHRGLQSRRLSDQNDRGQNASEPKQTTFQVQQSRARDISHRRLSVLIFLNPRTEIRWNSAASGTGLPEHEYQAAVDPFRRPATQIVLPFLQ